MPELRSRILQHLEPQDLTVLLRVEKGITAAVAQYLYHTIPSQVASALNRDTVSADSFGW